MIENQTIYFHPYGSTCIWKWENQKMEIFHASTKWVNSRCLLYDFNESEKISIEQAKQICPAAFKNI